MKNSTIMLIVLLACCMIISSNCVAIATELEWTQEIARQLVGDDWDTHIKKTVEPIIGYSFYFAELEGKFIEDYYPQLKLTNVDNKQTKSWDISYQPDLLHLVSSWIGSYQFEIEGGLEKSAGGTLYSSWLLTVLGRPLAVSISETRISDLLGDDQLLIQLTPATINIENQMIETELEFDFSTQDGTINRVRFTTWAGSKMTQPAAVVSQLVETNNKYESRYFALYLTAVVIPQEMIPVDMPIVSIGDIVGLQEIFTMSKEPIFFVPPPQFGLGISYADPVLGGYVNFTYPIESRYILAAEFEYIWDLNYKIAARLPVYDMLAFLCKVEGETGSDCCISLGVGDDVWLNPNLKVSADLYPLGVDVHQGKILKQVDLDIACLYESEKLSMSYMAGYKNKHLTHTIGTTLKLDSAVGISLTWQYSEGNHKLSAGLNFSWF